MQDLGYNDLYLLHGFNDTETKGGIYLDVAGPQMDFGGDKSGGSATPSINIRYISKLMGPVGGDASQHIVRGIKEVVQQIEGLSGESKISDKILGGVLDAQEFFAGIGDKAKLLGDIGLKDVVAPIADITEKLGKVPQLVREYVVPIERKLKELEEEEYNKINRVRDIINNLLNGRLADEIKDIIQTAISSIQETVKNVKQFVSTTLTDEIDTLDKEFENNLRTLANIRETALHGIKGYLVRNNRFGQTEIDTIRKLFNPDDIKLAIIGLIDDIQNETKELYNNVLNEIKVFGDKIKAIIDQMSIENVISGRFMKSIDEFKVYIESLTNTKEDFSEKEKNRLNTIIGKINGKLDYYAKTVDNVILTLDGKVKDNISEVRELCYSIIKRDMTKLGDIEVNLGKLGVDKGLITSVIGDVQSMVAFRMAAMKYDMLEKIRGFCDCIAKPDEQQYKDCQRDLFKERTVGSNVTFTDFNNLPQELRDWYLKHTNSINIWVTKIEKDARLQVGEYQKNINNLVGTEEKETEYLKIFKKSESEIKAQLNNVHEIIKELIVKFEDIKKVLSSLPKEIKLKYDWEPELKSYSVFQAEYEGRPSKLTLHTEIIKSLVELPRPPETRILGILTDFQINLLPSSPFLMIGFKQLRFESINGSFKTDVEIGGVKFGEALSFIDKLAKALNPNSGFFLKLTSKGLNAGYRFAMPAIITGGFNCFNLSINVGVLLPFDGGSIDLSFSISQRNRPFMITVSIYGGGGFFGITLTPNGVKTLEGSMEFGAATVLEIAGASGHASITAGIYFSVSVKAGKKDSTLTGFTRAGGDLRVINLINVCMEFYVGLAQEKRGSETYAVGEARLTVEIEIGFFHASKELTYRKVMQGTQGSGDMSTQGTRGLGLLSMQEEFPEKSLNYEYDEAQWKKEKELYAW